MSESIGTKMLEQQVAAQKQEIIQLYNVIKNTSAETKALNDSYIEQIRMNVQQKTANHLMQGELNEHKETIVALQKQVAALNEPDEKKDQKEPAPANDNNGGAPVPPSLKEVVSSEPAPIYDRAVRARAIETAKSQTANRKR